MSPYIDKERRTDIVVGDRPETPGELNFAICALVDTYARERLQCVIPDGTSIYSVLSEAHAQMVMAAAEFYRRVIAPYEDEKLKKNGEVFLCLAELP